MRQNKILVQDKEMVKNKKDELFSATRKGRLKTKPVKIPKPVYPSPATTTFSNKYRKFKDSLFSASSINRDKIITKFLVKLKRVKLSFLFNVRVFDKTRGKTYTIKKQRYNYKGRYNGLLKGIERYKKKIEKRWKESDVEVISITGSRAKSFDLNIKDILDISMESIGALDINGYIPVKTFCVNEGQCVVDFLMYQYGEYFKRKKIKRHNIYEIIEREETDDDFIDIKRTGVSTNQLLKICREYTIPLRAFDDNMKQVSMLYTKRQRYTHNKKRYEITPLYYMIKNNHLYPLDAGNIKVQSRRGKGGFKNTEKKKQKPKTFQCLPTDDTCSYEFMIDKMNETGKEPTYIRPAGRGKLKFCIDNVVYLPHIQEDIKPFVDYCKESNIEYTGQSTYSSFTTPFTDLPIKSSMNSQVSTIFNTYKRGQVHMGRMEEHITEYEIANKKVVDIVKCHRAILLDDTMKWYRLTQLDTFEDFETEEYDHEEAFYFIKTKDIELFSGDGIYTNKIIDVALKNKIKFELKAICRPSHITENEFVKPIKKFLKGTNDSDDMKTFKKMVINTIAGALGIDSIKNKFLKINKDINQVSNNLFEFEMNNPDQDIICEEFNGYFVYGYEKKTPIINNNRPLYLQVIEQANINLYAIQQKIIKSGGKVLFRYSDEIHYVGDYLDTDPTFSYRQSKITDIMNKCEEKPTIYITKILDQQLSLVNSEWEKNPENNSEQHQIIIDKLLKTGGLISGMGGTGKSHIIKHLKKAIETRKEEYYALAYTNDASLNIDGKTFHSTFNLKPTATEIEQGVIKNMNIPKYIIVDEVSMCNTFIYSILDQIRIYHPETKIILCGDFHQIRPIGEETLNFKDSYILKQLANRQKWFLEINHRTETSGGLVRLLKIMSRIGKDINGIPITSSDIKYIIKKEVKTSDNLTDMVKNWNIGYNNAKDKNGKRINTILNEHHAKMPHSIILDITGAEFKVIVGMRVVCKSASKSHCASKNEILEVAGTWLNEETGKRTIKLINKIVPNREALFLEYDVFIKGFELGYCITADKSQCKTLKGNVYIHQLTKLFSPNESYNRGYVAFGRATSLDNIYLANI